MADCIGDALDEGCVGCARGLCVSGESGENDTFILRRPKMKKIGIVVIALLVAAGMVRAELLVEYDPGEAESGTGAIVANVAHPDVVAGELDAVGVTDLRHDAGDRWSLWWTTPAEIDVDNDYIYFTVEPASGYAINFESVTVILAGWNGGFDVSLRTSVDGYAGNNGGNWDQSCTPWETNTFDVSNLGTQSGSVEIRIYALAGSPSPDWHDLWTGDGVQLFGSTTLADAAVLIGPGDGEINVGVDTILEWGPSPNHELIGYEVFFGAEPNELNPNFDMGSPVYSGLNESFDPDKPGTTDADLDWETTYYWRVDYTEPNAPGPDILWVGQLWSFTTAPPVPLIIQSPVSTTVPAGTDASLTVETRNAEKYEWYKVGSPDQLIVAVDSTADTDTLTISGTQQGDEGLYYCKVINSAAPDGVDTSTALVMTERLVARWEFEDNLNDTNPYPTKWGGSIVDPDAGNAVVPNISFVTDGAAIQGDYAVHIDNIAGEGYVLIDGSEGAFDFYRTGLTVSAWIKRVDFPEGDWWDRIVNYAGFTMSSVYPNNWLEGVIEGVGGVWIGPGVEDGGWHLETMTFDGGTMRGYLDGVYVGEVSGTPAVVAQLPLTIGGRDLGDRITATLDDIQVYSYAISSVDVAKLYTDLVAGATICVQDDDSLPSLQFDFSGNCRVDLADLAIFAADWQNCREVPTCLP